MGGIRVIAGDLRGRVIPFSNRKFDDADITPQKVKKALFSMIGERLGETSFLDLFAGSGQIGIEAMSRGARPTVINESDPRRHRFISTWIKGLDLDVPPLVLNMTAEGAMAYLADRGFRFDHIFLDPPYDRSDAAAAGYRDLIVAIARHGLAVPGGSIIVQHFSGNRLVKEIPSFSLRSTKGYGNTSLSRYS
ncbi:MAG: RsmD family RNA methyltransferase [Spirochaetes bacterium]|nr:RsmD family RNA methyltransferase [Spirochaetota bacterium]